VSLFSQLLSCFLGSSISLSCCYLSLSLSLSLCVSEHVFRTCVTFHLRIANQVGEDSYCRGGIVNTRCGYSCERSVRRHCPKALWRFRASASNSLSGRFRPPTYTLVRHIDQTHAHQDIRVCGDDHCEPHKRQYSNPKALWLLRVSI